MLIRAVIDSVAGLLGQVKNRFAILILIRSVNKKF